MFSLFKMVPSMPLVIRASFLFSGMFGIRLEGLKSNGGQPITVETAVPLNFTVPTSIVDPNGSSNPSGANGQLPSQTPFFLGPSSNEPFPSPIPDRTNNQRCLDKCQANVLTSENNGIGELAKGNGKPCGPGKCSDDEICVSWMKQANHRRRESPTMVHECLPNDGNHWNKMNPTGAKLCENGKTHSVLKDSQSCLKEQPPCDLTWKYVCIDEHDSPHSCKLKKCPHNACVENIYCGLEPPCFTEAVCSPDFLLPHDLLSENVFE